MAIRTVVTRGFGNGTFDGTIALATLRGYTPGSSSWTEIATGDTDIWTELATADTDIWTEVST